jgi:hypothetical protein
MPESPCLAISKVVQYDKYQICNGPDFFHISYSAQQDILAGFELKFAIVPKINGSITCSGGPDEARKKLSAFFQKQGGLCLLEHNGCLFRYNSKSNVTTVSFVYGVFYE